MYDNNHTRFHETKQPSRRYKTLVKPAKRAQFSGFKTLTNQEQLQTSVKETDFISTVKLVLEIEGKAVLEQSVYIDESINHAVKMILDCKGRVVLTGIGKSGIIARKICATLASTGTPSLFMHPAEGVHGDLGMVQKEDVVLAISNSGESAEVLHILPSIKQIGAKIISIVNNPESSLGKASDIVLRIGKVGEACSLGLAPTTSTTVTLALGDALAMALLKARNFTPEEFALYHPSGTLGNRLLLTVGELVERRRRNPVIKEDGLIREAIFLMTAHGSGAISVVNDDNKLVGIITDGDIRRAFTTNDGVLNFKVEELCNYHPVTIKHDALASDVLELMKEKKVKIIPVLDHFNHPISMLQIQSLIELGL